MLETLDDFISVIGKTIYREKSKSCNCSTCQAEEVFILDREHAEIISHVAAEQGIKYYREKI